MKFLPPCRSPHNRAKNRYVDVICVDKSRVFLPTVDGDQSTDYIHANFVDGCHGKNTYIAAQGERHDTFLKQEDCLVRAEAKDENNFSFSGPLPATFSDFWRMIWETGTVVIVMLTKYDIIKHFHFLYQITLHFKDYSSY